MSTFINKILNEANVLNEVYLNLFKSDIELRKKYGQECYDMLQKSYEKIGGLKGSGFNSVEDMIKNIPFWKLMRRDGVITACVFYKDEGAGRKRVAAGQNNTVQGKKDWKMMSLEELKTERSISEISGAPLSIQFKSTPDFIKYCIPFDEIKDILKKDITRPPNDDSEVLKYPELKDFFYQRLIGGHLHTKIAFGKPYQFINR